MNGRREYLIFYPTDLLIKDEMVSRCFFLCIARSSHTVNAFFLTFKRSLLTLEKRAENISLAEK